jgi:aquaporin Z
MLLALRNHWWAYLLEAAGLMAFMLGAGAFTTLFHYPGSPVQQALPTDLLRNIGIGACMGVVTFGIVTAIGERSGAHINPAVTLAFYREGRIGGWDAIFYTIFQFIGALAAPILLLAAIGEPFTHEKVKYAISEPKAGEAIAFAAEFVISLILMLAVLIALNSRRLEKKAPAIIALLIALYIAFESPLSGMSLNPARSFGSAFAAGEWNGLWVYFVSPVLAMLLATQVYRMLRRRGRIEDGAAHPRRAGRAWISDYKRSPRFPAEHEPEQQEDRPDGRTIQA